MIYFLTENNKKVKLNSSKVDWMNSCNTGKLSFDAGVGGAPYDWYSIYQNQETNLVNAIAKEWFKNIGCFEPPVRFAVHSLFEYPQNIHPTAHSFILIFLFKSLIVSTILLLLKEN